MEKRKTFGGSLGFVLAAAGSAVGLGNIWRFPYLAAKDGGGIFLFVYIILALTFGFTLLTTEIAIGRKTKQSPLTAFTAIKNGWKPIGIMACLVPAIILPYYSSIGGWVLKYFCAFISGQGEAAAEDGYFGGFITAEVAPIIFMAIFVVATGYIIFRGVNNGIEALSKVLMPCLIVLIVGICVFVLTLKSGEGDAARTGMQGLKIFMIPDFSGLTLKQLGTVVIDAMGQLFYSLSVAMGIMIAYGSYVKDKDNLGRSINQIEIFDTAIAVMAGIMIIPAVYVFMGREGLAASGPSLIFISLPKVFLSMGKIGFFVGILFFAMVLFAALTSCISIMEAIVSSIIDQFHISRSTATLGATIYSLIVGVIVCMGYNKLYVEVTLPNGAVGQILDIMDYVSNNIMMPVVAIGTCILIGWIVKPSYVVDEVCKNGESFGRKGLYQVMVKFFCPVLLLILLLKAMGIITFI